MSSDVSGRLGEGADRVLALSSDRYSLLYSGALVSVGRVGSLSHHEVISSV